jgi:Mn-dependent DtxR family transcriptional regulator
MLNTKQQSVLRVLYHLGRNDRSADLALVAEELGLSCVETDDLFVGLERAGLLDAERVRLTLPGLCLAVSLASRAERRGRARSPRRSASRAA